MDATKQWHPEGPGVLVTFEDFRLLEEQGPPLQELAPLLAKRMYEGRVRFLLDAYTSEEEAAAEAVIEWALSQPAVPYRRERHLTARVGCKSKCSPASGSEGRNNGT